MTTPGKEQQLENNEPFLSGEILGRLAEVVTPVVLGKYSSHPEFEIRRLRVGLEHIFSNLSPDSGFAPGTTPEGAAQLATELAEGINMASTAETYTIPYIKTILYGDGKTTWQVLAMGKFSNPGGKPELLKRTDIDIGQITADGVDQRADYLGRDGPVFDAQEVQAMLEFARSIEYFDIDGSAKAAEM